MVRALVIGLVGFLLPIILIVVLIATIVGVASACTSFGDVDGDNIPADIAKVYNEVGRQERVPPAILAAVGAIETEHGRNRSTSTAGAQGLMQFMPATFETQKCSPRASISNDRDAVCASARYLKVLYREALAAGFTGDKALAAMFCGYNSGNVRANYCEGRYLSDGSGAVAIAREYGLADGEVPGAKDGSDVTGAAGGCESGGDAAVIPVEFTHAKKVTEPRKFIQLPKWAVSPSRPPAMVDARIASNLLYMLKTYQLQVHDCLASRHNTHGSGDSCDIVPADDPKPRPGRMTPGWRGVTQLARDLGWRQPGQGYPGGYACNSGAPFAPAISIACYNGDLNHGDPDHYYGPSCACPHLHLTWANPVQSAPVALGSPPDWVMVFDKEKPS